MSTNRIIYQQLTSYRTYIVSFVIGAVGVILILLSDLIDWQGHLSVQTLLRDFGSLLIASVAVAVVWELSSKRAFYAEALSASRLVDDVAETGLVGASAKWHGNIDWQRLFRSTNNLEILFIYARTWRNTHRVDLIDFSMRSGAKAVIVLPDPNNDVLLTAIGQRVNNEAQEIKSSIFEAQNDFIEIFNRTGNAAQKLEIWYLPFVPMYSYYRFGEKAIFTVYQHRKERIEVPTFVMESGGTLYEFFEQEFESIVRGEHPIGMKAFPAHE
ncbi:MAG: hypothetical protein C4586_04410, partial [Anaerolineaceae bacterium]